MLRLVCLLAIAAAHARPDAPAQVNAWDANNTEPTVPATEAATTSEAPPPPPVHRRFPHAVLFGGTCGGTIISPRWVITAAHWRYFADFDINGLNNVTSLFHATSKFVTKKQDIFEKMYFRVDSTLFTSGRSVLAGTSNSDSGTGVSVRVKKLHVHPRFAVGPYWLNAKRFNFKQIGARWDFMLVELESPLPLDGVSMAAAALDGAPLPPDAPVGYAGYGADHHGGVMRPEMHAMALRTLADDRCAAALEQFDAQDMLCAEGRTDTRDSACNGDSGSGLVTDDGGPRRLVGVASWVENDAHECRPGAIVVFSRVAAVRPWIKQLTGV